MDFDLVLDGLDEEDAQPLKAALEAFGVDTEALWRLPQWNTGEDVAGVPSWRLGPRDSRDRVAPVLAGQMRAAAAYDGAVPLLLLYLIYEVEQAWEKSYHYAPMWDTLRGAQTYLDDHPTVVREADVHAVSALRALMRSLDHQIQVENAMTCGRLETLATQAAAVVRCARQAADQVDAVAPDLPRLAEHVAAQAAATESYYQAMAVTGRSLHDLFSGAAATDGSARPGAAALDTAIAALREAEHSSEAADHYDLSELRAHRFSLTALRDAQRRDWLWIDHGKVIYIYPFAIRGPAPGEVVAQAGAQAHDWLFSGVPPAGRKNRLSLDDLWDGSDYLGRRYDGSLIELPNVVMRDGHGNEIVTVAASIHLSALGNHYVRLAAELVAAPPHELYAALFRAAPEHGYAQVSFAGQAPGVTHPRLCDLAVRLAQDVGAGLGGAGAGVRVIARPGMFHVLVSVHAASLSYGYDPSAPRREALTIADLSDAVGIGVLSTPVTNCVGSLAEWIRYAANPDHPNHGVSLADDRILRTCNTTVMIALGSPEFSTATRETMAEFVASLDGLFAGWSSELAAHHEWISAQVPDLDALAVESPRGSVQLRELAATLERRQIRLHDFATEARSVAALIESPSLVASPVAATTLAALREAAGYPRQVAELNQKIEEVLDERLGLRIDALARQRAAEEARIAARAERRRRARLDTSLAIIAAIGISGLGQIIQSGYDVKVLGAVWIAGAIAALSAIIGLVVWLIAARAKEDHDERRPAAGHRPVRQPAELPRQTVPPRPSGADQRDVGGQPVRDRS